MKSGVLRASVCLPTSLSLQTELLLHLDRNHRPRSVFLPVFAGSFVLDPSSGLSVVIVPRRNQAEAGARASRHGRRKVKTRTKDEGEARGVDKRGS